jgi:hypothetical protein
MDAFLDYICASENYPQISANINANLQNPQIREEAEKMFGIAPKSISELGEYFCYYIAAPATLPTTNAGLPVLTEEDVQETLQFCGIPF